MIDLKSFAAKITSLVLIFSGLYQTFLSLNAIFFIYPHLNPNQARSSLVIQSGFIEKALLLYATMLIDGIYGAILLFKSSKEIEILHILIGIVLVIFSLFFITKTPFTTDPIFNYITNLISK
ncbi:hypothetical protein ISS86_01185 [Candidatus Microgenomates bacterium]|nr:hypothetical protein [Candidatus Microgenomates bacterium]